MHESDRKAEALTGNIKKVIFDWEGWAQRKSKKYGQWIGPEKYRKTQNDGKNRGPKTDKLWKALKETD